LLEEYELLYSEKDIMEVKACRDEMRAAFNDFLLYVYKNKDQMPVVANLLRELYQEYFQIVFE